LAYLYRIRLRAARHDVDLDAIVALHGFEDRTLFVDAVEIGHVSRVGCVLSALEPIAAIALAKPRVSPFGDAIAVHYQDVIARQRRRIGFFRSHVGEDQAAQLLHRITGMVNVRRGLDRFGWTID